MTKETARTRDFTACIDDLVDSFDAPQLYRAWDIVKGCVAVHAEVDRDPDTETPAQALEAAWRDLWLATADQDAPYTYWGLLWELQHGCGDEAAGETFMAELRDAGAALWTPAERGPAPEAAQPALRLVR